MAVIREKKGNIFNTSCHVIVNTVNCLGVMGKGIAYEFKLRYPDMFIQYKEHCDRGIIKPGILHFWTKSSPQILNFPTKYDWKHPSKLEFIEKGLDKFSKTYLEKNISSIAFPLLGTDAGGLDENVVVQLMKKYFEPLKDIYIEIYYFDPTAKDNLFDKLLIKLKRFEIQDYKDIIGLNKSQAKLLKSAIENGDCSHTRDLQYVPKIGSKTLEKIHSFAKSDKKILTDNEKNPKLF